MHILLLIKLVSVCTYWYYARIHEKAVRSDLSTQMKKSHPWRITYYELLFQCYLFELGGFVRFFLWFLPFLWTLALISAFLLFPII